MCPASPRREGLIAQDSAPVGRDAGARGWLPAIAVVAGISTISLLHYLTSPAHEHWHVVYQRLYYLPILVGAVYYGLRGGLLAAVGTAVSYLPHILLHWQHEPLYRSNQLAEIVMLLIFGAVSGVLIDRIDRERQRSRRTAEELARANERLRSTFQRLRLLDRLSALGALSAGIAHEIRNPLGGISGAVEILESTTDPKDERYEFVRIVQKEIERISGIVSRQLSLVQTTPPEPTPCDVASIAESIRGLLANEARSREVEVALDAPADLPPVETDEQGLRQALLNLWLNALQAVSRGGRVDVRIRRVGETVRIDVEDDGPGLSDAALAHAFDPFYSTKEGGTGLGLSIAFQIVNQLGGDLRAANRKRGGARFRLEIPLQPPPSGGIVSEAEIATGGIP